MVNLTYRNVAQLQKAREIVLSGADRRGQACRGELPAELAGVARPGATGAPRASGCGACRKKHGSNGVLGDIGVHILDFASYGSGLDIDHVFARLKTFDKAPGNKIGEYDLDANDSFTMAVDFTNGALGVIHATRWATGHFNELRLRVYGEQGGVEVQHRHDGSKLLRLPRRRMPKRAPGRRWRSSPCPTNYQRFADAVRAGKNQEPSFRHAANLQKVLDLAMVSDAERKELATV